MTATGPGPPTSAPAPASRGPEVGPPGWWLRHAVELVAVAAVVLRLVVVLAVGFNPEYFDVDGYHAQALAGVGGPTPTEVHPPGYAWFLQLVYAVSGPRPRIVYGIQALLGGLAIWLVGDAVRRHRGPGAGAVAAAVLAANLYHALFSALLASENLCFLGTAAVVWLAVGCREPAPRWRWLTAALVVGLAALVRSAMLGMVIGLAVCAVAGLAGGERRWRWRLATAVAVIGLGLLPSALFGAVRAERVGVFRIGSPWDAYNLWVGNNPAATGRIDPMPDLPELGAYKTAERYHRAGEVTRRAVEYALYHPVHELRLVVARASYLLSPPKRDLIYVYGWGWAGERPAALVWTVYWTSATGTVVLVLAAFAGWVRTGWERPVVVSVVLVGTGLLPYLVSIGDARFLLPLYPWIAVVAGRVAVPMRGRVRRRLAVAALLAAGYLGHTAYDFAATHRAVAAVAQPGGSSLEPAYHFAR